MRGSATHIVLSLLLLLLGQQAQGLTVMRAADGLTELDLIRLNGTDTLSASYSLRFQDSTETDYVLELGSPFIDYACITVLSEASDTLSTWSGGCKYRFGERPEVTRSFVIPIDLSENPFSTAVVLVELYNQGTREMVHLRMMKRSVFEKRRGRYNFLLSAYFGVVGFMLIFGFVILAVVGAKIRWSFLYYFAVGAMLVATLKGLSFQYLWPGLPEIHRISRYFLLNATFLGSFRFLQVFFRTARRLPNLNRAIWVMMVLHGVFTAFSISIPWIRPELSVVIIRLNDFLFLGAEVTFILTPILHYTRTRSPEAPWVLLAYSVHFASVVLATLFGLGVYLPGTRDFAAFDWLVWIGILWMNLVLAFVILYRIRAVMEKQEKNARALERERRRRFRDLVIQEEMERGRIGADLHDEAGSRLASIKMSLSGLAFDEAQDGRKKAFQDVIEDVDQLCEVNRQLSHQLLSVSLEKLGPRQALAEYQKRLLRRGRYVAFLHEENLFEQLDETIGTLVYRIVIELVDGIYARVPAFRIQFKDIRASRELCLVAEPLDEPLPVVDESSDTFRSLKTRVGLFHEQRPEPVVTTEEGVTIWVPLD